MEISNEICFKSPCVEPFLFPNAFVAYMCLYFITGPTADELGCVFSINSHFHYSFLSLLSILFYFLEEGIALVR